MNNLMNQISETEEEKKEKKKMLEKEGKSSEKVKLS
jgi:hypothetical protein